MKRLLPLLVLLIAATSIHAELNDVEKSLTRRVDGQFDDAIRVLAETVDIPSATENLAGVKRLSDFYAKEFEKIGFTAEWVPLPEETKRAGHFVAVRAGSKGPVILFIGHLDTVLESEPWRRDGDLAYGSGVADMKAGNLVILAALRALHDEGLLDERRIIVVFTGDEEAPGRPLSVTRATLVEAARRSDVALAYEEAGEGSAVVGRRGISTWQLDVRGETGHSSGIFSLALGSGAVFEAARILSAFHENLREPYLTFNPSIIVGGTNVELDGDLYEGSASGKSNIVAQKAIIKGDLRFLTAEQLVSAKSRMVEIVGRHLPGTSASIEFFDSYPGMAPTEGNRALLAEYDAVSRDLGLGAVAEYDPGRRGAGDVSFVAEFVDALDGLGAFGERSHAPGESIEVERLRDQIKRTALLVHRLGNRPGKRN